VKTDFDAFFSGAAELSPEYANHILDYINSCNSLEEWYDFAAMYMGMSV